MENRIKDYFDNFGIPTNKLLVATKQSKSDKNSSRNYFP